MENLVVKGQITATSKKQSEGFTQQTPTKTAYVSISNEADSQKLKDFGLTEYESKTGEKYFIIKFPAEVMVYLPNGHGTKRPELSQVTVEGIETNNFMTPDNKELHFNIIKSEHMNNEFHRLQAIRIEEESDIQEVKPENPFGDDLAF